MTTSVNPSNKTGNMNEKNSKKQPQDIRNILEKGGGMVETICRLEEDFKHKKAEFADFLKDIPKVVNCTLHDKCTAKINEEEMFAYYFRTGKMRSFYRICETTQMLHLVNEKHGKWLAMGIPKKVVDADFDNFEVTTNAQQRVLQRVKDFMARGNGFLMMLGNNGTGKSHLAAACIRFAGYGRFVPQGDLIDKLRQSYEMGSKIALVAEFQRPKVLVIDEIDASLKGDDITPFLYQLLNHRYEHDLITILTTNEDLDTLKQILGSRVEDRIASNYIVANFTWDSHRRKHASTKAGNKSGPASR